MHILAHHVRRVQIHLAQPRRDRGIGGRQVRRHIDVDLSANLAGYAIGQCKGLDQQRVLVLPSGLFTWYLATRTVSLVSRPVMVRFTKPL